MLDWHCRCWAATSSHPMRSAACMVMAARRQAFWRVSAAQGSLSGLVEAPLARRWRAASTSSCCYCASCCCICDIMCQMCGITMSGRPELVCRRTFCPRVSQRPLLMGRGFSWNKASPVHGSDKGDDLQWNAHHKCPRWNTAFFGGDLQFFRWLNFYVYSEWCKVFIFWILDI